MSAPGYSALDRLLHHLALGSRMQSEMAFDIERSLFLASAPAPETHRHVFVQGLARAGTTVLMRALHASGEFASLTYADMPFVMCANAWHALTRRFPRMIETRERAHGDGLQVDAESPEALEEVFWRTMCGDQYIQPKRLVPHSPGKAELDRYTTYLRLVLRRGERGRYLTKNNNNVLRLPALARHFADSVFLVPIRDPMQQAASLLRMHQRFSGSDPFTRRYMTWLGHHEFGDTHRPFRFGDHGPGGSPEAPAYWLQLWCDSYGYLESLAATLPNVYVVPYEALCGNEEVWRRVLALANVDVAVKAPFRAAAPVEVPLPGHEALREAAQRQHRRFTAQALARLGC